MDPEQQLVLGVICARGGSKGLKRKNLQLLNGETLVARAVRQADESGAISNLIVSTDDQEIADSASNAGAEIPFIRPKELSLDLTTTEETLKHAILTYEEIKGLKFDIAVFITPTDIFREPAWIRQCVEQLKNDESLESCFVGHNTHKNFWEQSEDGSWVRVREWMSVYSSRQVRKPIVREDTGLACASRAHLWREGRRIGDRVHIIRNDDDFTSIDIHTREDLELAQCALDIRSGAQTKEA